MGEKTNISWADHTFNGWEGCQKVGPGCDHCYAEARNARFGRGTAPNWGPGAPRRRTSESNWELPKRWERQAAAFMAEHGRRQRVFCASLADVFDNAVDLRWREDLFALIRATPSLDWLLLTKRIGNVPAMVDIIPGWLPDNVWLGATIVNQAEADRDIPKLLAVPARVRFLSLEPLLGPVDLQQAGAIGAGADDLPPYETRSWGEVDWVIVGGESGPHARPMHPQWTRDIRDQCAAAGVPMLFKQWGEWVPYEHAAQPPFLWSQHGHEIDGHALPDFESDDGKAQREWHCDWADQLLARRVGKKAAGRLLDGVQHDGFPEGG